MYGIQVLDTAGSAMWDAQLQTFEILARGYATNMSTVGFSNPLNKRVYLFIRPVGGDYTQSVATHRADSVWAGPTGGIWETVIGRDKFNFYGTNLHNGISDGDLYNPFTFEYLIVTPQASPVSNAGWGFTVVTAAGESVFDSNKNYLIVDFVLPRADATLASGLPQTFLFPNNPPDATRFVLANSLVALRVTDGWLGEFYQQAVACWIKSPAEISLKMESKYFYSSDADNGDMGWVWNTRTGGIPFLSGYVVD